VGYVRTGYAERNISDVLADVATYGGWEAQSSAFAMEGIFFDESPHQYAAETVDYLERINLAVKNVTGLTGERTVSERNFPARTGEKAKRSSQNWVVGDRSGKAWAFAGWSLDLPSRGWRGFLSSWPTRCDRLT
jgi:hypothetical protein